MKKLQKLPLYLAMAIAFSALMGCGQSTSYKYIEQVSAVSNFKVKAYPGANYLSWSASEVSNGYAIFRDGKYLKTVSNTETSYFDYISTKNEWKDGQEVKYQIQNCGRDLSRSATEADTVIAGSAFSEVTIKAINPGLKSEVIYKVPAYYDDASGTTQLGSFEDFDYSNAESVATLTDPFATLIEKDYHWSLLSFSKIPYLNTKIIVSNEEETENIDFTFDLRAEDMEVNLSELGNAEVITPFIGMNKIWAEFSDPNGYYSSKKVLLTSKYMYSTNAYQFKYSEVKINWDASRERYVATWPIPINSETKEKVTDFTFYLYTHDAGWYDLKRIELFPEIDSFNDCYKASLDISYDIEYMPWRFFAVSSNGEMYAEYVDDVPVVYAEGIFSPLYEAFGGVSISVYGSGMELNWNGIRVEGKEVSGTYEVWYSTNKDSVTGEWKDYSLLQVEIQGNRTSTFMTPQQDTNYVVKAYYKGDLVGKGSVTYNYLTPPEPEVPTPTPTPKEYFVYAPNGAYLGQGNMNWFISEYVNRYGLIENSDYYVYSDSIELTVSGYARIYPNATFNMYYEGQPIMENSVAFGKAEELLYIAGLAEGVDYSWSGTDVILSISGNQKINDQRNETLVILQYDTDNFSLEIPFSIFNRFCEVIELVYDIDYFLLSDANSIYGLYESGYNKLVSYMNNI